jgi:hypothetical protein
MDAALATVETGSGDRLLAQRVSPLQAPPWRTYAPATTVKLGFLGA